MVPLSLQLFNFMLATFITILCCGGGDDGGGGGYDVEDKKRAKVSVEKIQVKIDSPGALEQRNFVVEVKLLTGCWAPHVMADELGAEKVNQTYENGTRERMPGCCRSSGRQPFNAPSQEMTCRS